MIRRTLQVAAILATLVVGAAAAAIIVSQTAWFKDWLRGFIVREANGYLNGQLSIGRLGGNLFFGAELENVAIVSEGEPAIRVKDVGIGYSVIDFLSGGITIDDIRVNQPVVHLRRTDRGWNVASLVKRQAQEADRRGPGRPISIGSIGISDGTIVVDDEARPTGTAGRTGGGAPALPSRIDRLDLKAAFSYSPSATPSTSTTCPSKRGSRRSPCGRCRARSPPATTRCTSTRCPSAPRRAGCESTGRSPGT